MHIHNCMSGSLLFLPRNEPPTQIHFSHAETLEKTTVSISLSMHMLMLATLHASQPTSLYIILDMRSLV